MDQAADRRRDGHCTEDVEGRSTRRRPRLSEHQRELPLILGHKLIARGQELEDGDHGLAGLLADSLAIALDQFEAEGQGVGILAGGGKGFGQGELELEVVGTGGQRRLVRPRRCRPPRPGVWSSQLGLEPLGLGLEETAPLQGGEPCRRVLDPSLRQGDPGQADLGLGQVGLERQRLAILRLGGTRVGALQARGPPRRAIRPRWAGAGRSRSGWPTRAERPTKASATAPSRTPKTAGMDRTPNWPATSGFRSMSTLASTNLPPYSCASFSRTGLSIRQGPHQGAQKSTTTGTVEDRSMISRTKVSDVTSMT